MEANRTEHCQRTLANIEGANSELAGTGEHRKRSNAASHNRSETLGSKQCRQQQSDDRAGDPLRRNNVDKKTDEADQGLGKCFLSQAVAVSVKNVLLLGYGMTLGFPTIVIPAIQGGDGREPALEKDIVLSKDQISWLSSINLICVPLGCVFSGMLTQPIGRRRAMQLVNIPILIAWLLFHYAPDVSFLYLGLALAGFSGGLSEAPVLTYVAEVTEPRYRGMLAATGSTCVILGVLMEFLMGSFLRWRTVAIFSAIVPILSTVLLFFIPESPVWLTGKGRTEEARAALARLRGWVDKSEVEAEFTEMQEHLVKCAGEQKGTGFLSKITIYTQKSFLQPFGIILFCFFIGHFCGMTTLQTYAVQIFHTLKAPIDKYYATCLLGLSELIGTLFCVFLVHRTGKRPLIFVSTLGCGVCFAGAATYAYFLNLIPGTTVQNVVANVSSIRADIAVIPLRQREVIAEVPPPMALNVTDNAYTHETSSYNGSTGVLYSAQSFSVYYVNGTLEEPINTTIHYGEYIKSAIPKDVFVPLPHVNKNKFVWLPLTLLLGSAFLTHMGIRLIPWILIGELFSPNVRSAGSGLAGGIAYIFGFIANKSFLSMLASFTLPGTFWIYAGTAVAGAAILYKILPETEGKSLQEIETFFLPKDKVKGVQDGVQDLEMGVRPVYPAIRILLTCPTPESAPKKPVEVIAPAVVPPVPKPTANPCERNCTKPKVHVPIKKSSTAPIITSPRCVPPPIPEPYRKLGGANNLRRGSFPTVLDPSVMLKPMAKFARLANSPLSPIPDFHIDTWDSNIKFEQFLNRQQKRAAAKVPYTIGEHNIDGDPSELSELEDTGTRGRAYTSASALLRRRVNEEDGICNLAFDEKCMASPSAECTKL